MQQELEQLQTGNMPQALPNSGNNGFGSGVSVDGSNVSGDENSGELANQDTVGSVVGQPCVRAGLTRPRFLNNYQNLTFRF